MSVPTAVSYLLDECPRCGYGPLGMHTKERRKRCPACFLRLPAPEPVAPR